MDLTRLHKRLWVLVCMVLLAAAVLCMTGCSQATAPPPENTVRFESGTELGEGATTIPVTVADLEGNTWDFTVHTDKTIVGEALEEVGLLEGEEGPYGLYIHAVNGITADYDTDGTYWAFYVDDAPATTGVDGHAIAEGEHYGLRIEKP